LFTYFGGKLLKDAHEMEGDGPSEELQEVEEELEKKKGEGNEADDDDIEDQTKVSSKSKKSSQFSKIGVEAINVFSQVSICN
jgi:hypothetical protein